MNVSDSQAPAKNLVPTTVTSTRAVTTTPTALTVMSRASLRRADGFRVMRSLRRRNRTTATWVSSIEAHMPTTYSWMRANTSAANSTVKSTEITPSRITPLLYSPVESTLRSRCGR